MLNTPEHVLGHKASIVTAGMQVGVTAYQGSTHHGEMVLLALQNFGHLIRSVALRNITFSGFADVIEMNYDLAEPKTAATVKALREVHALN